MAWQRLPLSCTNPLTGKSIIYRYYYPIPNAGDRAMEINCVCIDNRDRIWAGTNHGGLGLLNEVWEIYSVYR